MMLFLFGDAEIRNRVTWASMVSDLQEQIRLLLVDFDSNREDDYRVLRNRVIQNWANDYSFFYSDRFLTNTYLNYAEGNFSDTKILSWDTSAMTWPKYNQHFESFDNEIEAFADYVF